MSPSGQQFQQAASLEIEYVKSLAPCDQLHLISVKQYYSLIRVACFVQNIDNYQNELFDCNS